MTRLHAMFCFVLAVASPLAVADECKRCEKKLELSETEWQCLVDKLPALDNTKRNLFFLAVSPSACDGLSDDGSRGSGTKLPQTNTSAATVLRLSRAQVACLTDRLPTVSAVDGKVIFEFSTACAGEAAPADADE
ncbi:MAG: hypothetical protein AAFZ58_11820 [Pseudomonadota bacterium]